MKNNSNLPGFTASILVSGLPYKFDHLRKKNRYSKKQNQVVLFAAAEQEGEVIEVYSCNVGEIQLGEGSNTVCINPDTIWGDPYNPGDPQPPGDGGGGGGYSGGTKEMVKACLNASVKAGCNQKDDSVWHRCENLRCKIEYCEKHDCTEDEISEARSAQIQYDEIYQCDNKHCKNKKLNAVFGFNNILYR